MANAVIKFPMSTDQPKYCGCGRKGRHRYGVYKCLVPTARSKSMWVSSYDMCMKYCGQQLYTAVHGSRLNYDDSDAAQCMILSGVSYYNAMQYNPYYVISRCNIISRRKIRRKISEDR